MNTFFKGTLFLVIAAFLGECLEFFINMILARELGEGGMGLYMAILPLVFLIVVLASLELPISISKFIAENDRTYHRSLLYHAIKLAIFLMGLLMIVTILTIPFVPIFHRYHPFIRWLVVILIPIISLSSIARGYFMGLQQMGKIAISNFLRRVIQLILLVFLFQLFSVRTETALLIALSTLVGSEVVVFVYLFRAFITPFYSLRRQPQQTMSGRNVRKHLLAVSLPATGLRIFHAVTNAIQPFLIIGVLVVSGLSETIATEQFGVLAGVALTIGFFPVFIAHSFLTVLIPTVSKAYADKDFPQLKRLLQQVTMMTFLYGIPAVVLFLLFAEPLTQLFFTSTSAAVYLKMLWPFFLFHFFVIPLQAFLIGFGLIKDALYHALWATTAGYLLIYLFGSHPHFQMHGVIIGMNMEAVLLTLMHYVTVCRKTGVSLTLRKTIASHH